MASLTKAPRALGLGLFKGNKLISVVPTRSFNTKNKKQQARLILQDGYELPGEVFGDPRSIAGEVVFNTGMVGYPESLTDPSYSGQILCMTYPLIGNYGVPHNGTDQHGLLSHFESDRIHIRGLIVSDYSYEYSHWLANRSLSDWLKENNVPALTGIDTRALTKRIRTHGAMLGKIVMPNDDIEFDDPNKRNLVADVSCKEAKTYGTGDIRILAVDCGMKTSIVRNLVERGATVTVVPWNHDIVRDLKNYDGLFISNGPGDPQMADVTINNLRQLIQDDCKKPIFGICLGHQLLALAAGAKTFKLRYGHRGHNQPCIDLKTNRCYITSQNHGFAVENSTLPEDWTAYFVNANDNTSEGFRHKTKPYFSVQFHPEARGGPLDTGFLFDSYLALCRGTKNKLYNGVKTSSATEAKRRQIITDTAAQSPPIGELLAKGLPTKDLFEAHSLHGAMPPTLLAKTTIPKPKKVLILGSGGLSIGQAGEFDYSGSQAIKAVKEEGIETVLMNANIATVQTAKGLADKIYYLPVTVEYVEAVIEKEKPDGLLLQFGGQTALNCGVELANRGILSKHNVRIFGTSVDTIIAAEDRAIFNQKLAEIKQPFAKSVACTTLEESLKAANAIKYPVICRAAFALGGLGSGFANNDAELTTIVNKALTASPQVLIERSMKGWKEVEYEVVRDSSDNCITVCNMENFDPLGIHTGDSIVCAPSQTLDDYEYHMLRTAAIDIVRHLKVIGECNVQYALHPTSREYAVIEVNPRLSRSSALASKATGYPLAFIAAKLALGYSLPQLRNNLTHVTSACFEPSLDYIVTKIPRWDLKKFGGNVSNKLGSAMKSVGEVMAIGRSFEESFQKAVRMVNLSSQGFESQRWADAPIDELKKIISVDNPTDQRIYQIHSLMARGVGVDELHDITKIDKWYLYKLARIVDVQNKIKDIKAESPLEAKRKLAALLPSAKKLGMSDLAISNLLPKNKNFAELDMMGVRELRKQYRVVPYVKQIDTLAGEFPAKTNYLYATYHGSEHDVNFDEHGVLVLGGGSYCIGNSVEFDYSAVSCIRSLRKEGEKTIMMNYNPETVSTDYDESDRLYFEELSLERVLDVAQLERPQGVVVSVGGQIPNNLVMPLHKAGVPILGTRPERIDQAEDRKKFSSLCDAVGVEQPPWSEFSELKDAQNFCKKVGFPVLVRPSYVLSGAAMRVVHNETDLKNYLSLGVSREHPVVISKMIMGAKEVDMDGVAQHGHVVVHAVSEHIEQAGVHSGDASLMLPAQTLSDADQEAIVAAGKKIVEALSVSGPFNAQFILDNGVPKIIECNVRASRSFPFVSKILGVDFIKNATSIMLGKEISPADVEVDMSKINFVGVKVPQFSFTRLGGADPVLGVEMASTGEVACFGEDRYEAFMKAMQSVHGFRPPKKGVLFMSVDHHQTPQLAAAAGKYARMGYKVYSMPDTAEYLKSQGVDTIKVQLPTKGGKEKNPNVLELLRNKDIDLAVCLPTWQHNDINMGDGYTVRRAAVDFSVPTIVNLQVADFLAESLAHTNRLTIKGIPEYVHANVYHQ